MVKASGVVITGGDSALSSEPRLHLDRASRPTCGVADGNRESGRAARGGKISILTLRQTSNQTGSSS